MSLTPCTCTCADAVCSHSCENSQTIGTTGIVLTSCFSSKTRDSNRLLTATSSHLLPGCTHAWPAIIRQAVMQMLCSARRLVSKGCASLEPL